MGAIGQIDFKAEKAFKTLLILDSLRGTDSTGAAIVHRGKDNDAVIIKALGNPFELVESQRFDKVMKGVHRVMIGHNRFATQGKVTTRNAHPFEFDKLVGAHNGTIQNKYVLDSANDFDVDSQALYHHIDKFGVKSAVKNLNGAWALTWWNKEDSTMNFLRNKERPLFFSESEDNKMLFWASEAWMLTVALSRHDIKYTTPYQIPEDAHLIIPVAADGTLGDDVWDEDVKSEYVQNFTSTRGQNGWNNHNNGRITQQNSQFNNHTQKNVTSISQVKSEYSGKKGRLLRALSYHTDKNGGGYFQLFDRDYPGLRIRLYVNKGSVEMDWLGKEFTGDVEEKPTYSNGDLYHKIIHSSTKLVIGTPVVKLSPPDEEEEKKEDEYMDKNGKLISLKDWNKRYGNCCVCNGDVSPTGMFRFAKNCDETLCSVCMEDHSITEYMGL